MSSRGGSERVGRVSAIATLPAERRITTRTTKTVLLWDGRLKLRRPAESGKAVLLPHVGFHFVYGAILAARLGGIDPRFSRACT